MENSSNVNLKQRHSFIKPILPYIKLQLKLGFSSDKEQAKWKKVLNWITKILLLAVALFFIYLFVRNLTRQTNFIRGNNFLILFVTLSQLFLLIYAISFQVKRLYKPSDLRIISTFPLTTFQRYLGEIIILYIRLLIYSFALFFPFLIIYGFAGKIGTGFDLTSYLIKYPVQYIFSSLFSTFLLPIFPFALSLVISVPFMFLSDFLSNKNITKLIIFIVIFAGILTVYALLLNFMADYYIHAKNNKEVLLGIQKVLTRMDKWYNPSHWITQITLFTNIGLSFGIYFGICVFLCAAGVAITKPLYKKFSIIGSTLEGSNNMRTVKVRNNNPYWSIFCKEVKNIIRTPTYAFFYLGVAFTMPIMTYLITDLVAKLGAATVGSQVFFGFSLTTLLIILSLIGSYSANVISREGKEFYITKVTPLTYRKQLFAKLSVNFIVSFVGLLICIVVLGCTTIHKDTSVPGLTVAGLFMIFGISTLFLIGITFNGVNIELVRPKIDLLSGQNNESNIVIQLIISLLVAIFLSLCSILFDALIPKDKIIYLQLIIFFLSFIYALVNFLVWFFTCEKKYTNIEIR